MITLMSKNLAIYWNKLVNRRIFRAAIMVASVTALVKVVAIVKELLVAWKFGTAESLDAFLIAFVIPSFVINVIAGSFNAALIPTFIRVREQEGSSSAQRLFSGATLLSIGLLLIITILILAVAPLYLPKIAANFSVEKLELTYRLLYALAPTIILSGIITVWSAVLNAGERFALTAISPILTPAISIAFLLLNDSWGVFALARGLVCGAFLEMTIVGVALQRQGISLLPKWYGFDTHLRQVASQYTPMIAGACLISSAGLVDDSMAAMLSPGSVAALSYGNRIITLPINLAITALRIVVTPHFSKMVAYQNWIDLRSTLKRYLKIIFVSSLPIVVLLIFFSEPLVKIFLQRGSFTANDTALVAQIQSFFALQIPFYIGNILLVILINSLSFNRILIKLSFLNLLINISLNYFFMRWLDVKGIALSTSCVYIFSFIYLLIVIYKKMPKDKN